MRIILGLMLGLSLTACGTTRWERMPTVEDKLSKIDDEKDPNGMMLTNKGAVLDIKVEEVKEKQKRLEQELADSKLLIDQLREQLSDEKMKVRALRMSHMLSVDLPDSRKPASEN